MSEPKWTPGPWFYDDFTEGIYAGRDNRIGGAEPASGPLMAASPDLYEALEALTALCEAPPVTDPDDPRQPNGYDWGGAMNAAAVALAKARGET